MSDAPQFSRHSVVAACNLLADRIDSHARFERTAIEIGSEDILIEGSIQAKANVIAQYLIASPDHRNWEGEFLADKLVYKAASLPGSHEVDDFVRALARDGFTVTAEGGLLRMLPETAGFPQAEDEVHRILNELGMATAKGHLDQAIENHTSGNWAAANGELRKVLENIFDEIAEKLAPAETATTPRGHPRRQLLANIDPPFLIEGLGEWSGGREQGKNFVNGVFKRLHPEGGHPGLSDEEDCTFRLHIVLLVARVFLRRAKSFSAEP